MKYLILLTTLLAFNAQIHAQKCAYKVNEEDPMTGESKLATQLIVDICRLYMVREGNTFSFKATYYFDGEHNVIIPKGNSLTIRMSDDSFLKFTVSEDSPPITKAGNGVVGTRYEVHYTVTEDQIETIRTLGIIACGADLNGTKWTYKLKEKETKKSKDAARCLLL